MRAPENEQRNGTGTQMGPLPAAAGCECRICLPDRSYTQDQRDCIETVIEHGWQVMLIPKGGRRGEPEFAYTVGLGHRQGHPELVMSGLRGELLHPVLNHVAQRVMAGLRLHPGDLVEGVLGHVPVLVEELNQVGLDQTVTGSRWFHRGSVRALQLVWPDTQARFAWQAGANRRLLESRQPPKWRRPVPRVGVLAAQPAWSFARPGKLEVVACVHVVDFGRAICHCERRIQHGSEEWYFHCGESHRGPDDFALAHLSHLIAATPSLRGLTDLGEHGFVWREGPDRPWQRGRSKARSLMGWPVEA